LWFFWKKGERKQEKFKKEEKGRKKRKETKTDQERVERKNKSWVSSEVASFLKKRLIINFQKYQLSFFLKKKKTMNKWIFLTKNKSPFFFRLMFFFKKKKRMNEWNEMKMKIKMKIEKEKLQVNEKWTKIPDFLFLFIFLCGSFYPNTFQISSITNWFLWSFSFRKWNKEIEKLEQKWWKKCCELLNFLFWVT